MRGSEHNDRFKSARAKSGLRRIAPVACRADQKRRKTLSSGSRSSDRAITREQKTAPRPGKIPPCGRAGVTTRCPAAARADSGGRWPRSSSAITTCGSAAFHDGRFSLWQTLLFFRVNLVAFEIVRGWRLGMLGNWSAAGARRRLRRGLFGGRVLLRSASISARARSPHLDRGRRDLALIVYAVSTLGAILLNARANKAPGWAAALRDCGAVGDFLGLFSVWTGGGRDPLGRRDRQCRMHAPKPSGPALPRRSAPVAPSPNKSAPMIQSRAKRKTRSSGFAWRNGQGGRRRPGPDLPNLGKVGNGRVEAAQTRSVSSLSGREGADRDPKIWRCGTTGDHRLISSSSAT